MILNLQLFVQERVSHILLLTVRRTILDANTGPGKVRLDGIMVGLRRSAVS